MAKAHVNPSMLRRALERARLRPDELSATVQKDASTIEQWLDGDDAPTFKQAQKLAKRLRVPFGYLFLEAPPAEDLPLPDFRRAQSGRRGVSLDLRDVIADVMRKQDWYRDYRAESEDEPFSFVGRYSRTTPVLTVAADIESSLDFEERVRPASQPGDFLRAFVRQVEEIGVLVMRNGVVRQATNRALRVDEFRGFSIADPMAPVIFINNADANAAQVFTLAHELAHIWIGEGGISDADPAVVSDVAGDVENYCNEVAAQLLLPWERLAQSWANREDPVDQWIARVARQFHVSTVMVARQLWTHQAIDREEFFDLYQTEREKWSVKAESSGGDYYRSAPIRNSRRLTEAVLESVSASETSIRDASRLLGVKPAKLPKLEESMGAR